MDSKQYNIWYGCGSIYVITFGSVIRINIFGVNNKSTPVSTDYSKLSDNLEASRSI